MAGVIFTVNTSYAQAPVSAVPNEPSTPASIEELVHQKATEYQVSYSQMLATIRCESSLNPKAIGDHGTSFGLSQIHLPAHPTVTKEQAFDSEFAITFMAKNFKDGKQNMWSCWNSIYGK